MTTRQSEPREPRSTPLTEEEQTLLDEAYAAAKDAADAYHAAQDAKTAAASALKDARDKVIDLTPAFNQARAAAKALEQQLGVGYYGAGDADALALIGARMKGGGS